MASTIWASSNVSEPGISGTKPTRSPSSRTSASRPVVPSAPQMASRPPPASTCTEYASIPDFLRCALMPRSRSASVIRRARFSSMAPDYPACFAPPPERRRGRHSRPFGLMVRLYNFGVTDDESGAFELGTDGPKVILVGVDDSVTSLRAGAYAAGLARRQRARLVCVYVEQLSALYGAGAGAGAGAIAAQDQALEETAADLRRRAEEYAGVLGMPITIVVARGDPYTELRRLADE